MRHANSTFRAIFLGIAMLPGMALADPAQDLFKSVLDNARLCSYWNNDAATRADCFIKAAPQKCEAEAMKFLATQNRELFFCVASCVNAGVASRTFGECSRELDSDNAGVELAEIIAQQEKEALAYYWARANEANDEVLKLYPYLTTPQNKLDQVAVSNFDYYKKQYLTVNADPREAVYRAGRETDAWRSLGLKAAEKKHPAFQSSAPMTSEMVDAVLGNTPPRNGGSAPSDCVIRPTMTNEDYRACGITPPGQ